MNRRDFLTQIYTARDFATAGLSPASGYGSGFKFGRQGTTTFGGCARSVFLSLNIKIGADRTPNNPNATTVFVRQFFGYGHHPPLGDHTSFGYGNRGPPPIAARRQISRSVGREMIRLLNGHDTEESGAEDGRGCSDSDMSHSQVPCLGLKRMSNRT